MRAIFDPASADRVVTAAELCTMLRISGATLHRWRAKGLQSFTARGMVGVRLGDVADFLDKHGFGNGPRKFDVKVAGPSATRHERRRHAA